MIWHKPVDLDRLNATRDDSMVQHLGIEFTAAGDDYLEATMPVDQRTHQPMGILHGGASVSLAETVGSVAAQLVLDDAQHYCVGLDINANHLRAKRDGVVTARATPIHLGRSTQVWQIHLTDERGRMICVSRLTMAVLEHSERGTVGGS
jgi:1,4-dihydroxy-2-naphthoyl-CoA hydrolase